jgi:hypothetical protein
MRTRNFHIIGKNTNYNYMSEKTKYIIVYLQFLLLLNVFIAYDMEGRIYQYS